MRAVNGLTAETIYALSSGGLPSGVAVIRISGPAARSIVEAMTGRAPPADRRAALRSLKDQNGELLDQGLVLFLPGPNSFTGEDCAELQIHGSRATVGGVLNAIGSVPNCRMAEPGEFTRRAFENGRIDLTEAEGLSDLIAAQTALQRRQALEIAGGGLARLYEGWAQRLLHARAMIEAEFDFVDEEDIPGSVSNVIWDDLETLLPEIDRHLESARVGERIRDGFKVAIVGAPNAGKSSLINYIAKREIAIVSPHAGTTRDVLHVDIDLRGIPVTLYDTAGLRESEDVIEMEGVKRARSTMDAADVVLHLIDLSQPRHPIQRESEAVIPVGTKCDLAGDAGSIELVTSTVTGEGVDALLAQIYRILDAMASPATGALPNRLRHRQYLVMCRDLLADAVRDVDKPLELRAEDLRGAADALGRITGRTDVEDLLDTIFSAFCIGK